MRVWPHGATHCNAYRRIVAPKAAGSSPVDHPRFAEKHGGGSGPASNRTPPSPRSWRSPDSPPRGDTLGPWLRGCRRWCGRRRGCGTTSCRRAQHTRGRAPSNRRRTGVDHVLASFLVFVPQQTLPDVAVIELPALVGVVEASLGAPLLLVFGDVEEKLSDCYAAQGRTGLTEGRLLEATSAAAR
jgi:hypothetical protein